MLGTVLDKITALVGRAFVVSAFFPVVLFVAASSAALVAMEGLTEMLRWWGDLKALQTASLVGFLLVVVAGAYLLMTISPVLKRLVEGAYPLGVFGERLLSRKRRYFARERGRLRDAMEAVVRVRARRDASLGTLQAAYQQPAKPDASLRQGAPELEEVEKSIRSLQSDGRPPSIDEIIDKIEEVAAQVKSLYQSGRAATQVERLHQRVIELWDDATRAAEAKLSEGLANLQSRFAYSEGVAGVRPTALGNIMAAAWSYPYTRYRIDAAFMWPRLQKVIPAEYFRVVEDARISYDFCVAMTFLALLFAGVWLVPVLTRKVAWPWLWLPGAGLLTAALCHRAAIEAARAFGAILRTCFDLFRFGLLQELHIPVPANPKSERATWDQLNRFMIFEEPLDLEYAHPDRPSPKRQPWTLSGLVARLFPRSRARG